MGPILATLLQTIVSVVVPVLVKWFQDHVLPHSATLQALEKGALRAQARTWVKDFLAEIGQALVTKGVVPVWLQPELPALEAMVDQFIETALDSAGL